MEKLIHRLPPSKSPSQFSYDNLRHWMVAFVVCTFNVDVGPEIELVHPPNTPFSTSDLTAICFNSFPETQDAEVTDDLVFHFVMRNNSHNIKLSSPCSPHGSPNDFYGHAIFRQEHDRTSKRSFNQKTLVLVSNHNFPAFFLKLLRRMTSSGPISDPTTLEAACSQIAAWPPPSVGRHELPFLGSLLLLDIAPHSAFALQGLSTPLSAFTGGATSATYAYEPIGSWSSLMRLMPSLSELYTVFEKLLLCENIVILAKNPQTCSQFASAIIDLIRPVPYRGEIRPYITMQSDFFTSGFQGGTPSHFLVGITNPFLLQRFSALSGTDSQSAPHVTYLQNREQSIPMKRERSLRHRSSTSYDVPGGLGPLATAKKYLKADKDFVQQLDSMLKDESAFEEVGPFVRRHFAELTAQFLAPFSRYFAASMSSSVATPGGNLAYANFSEADFLQSLSKHGTSVNFKGQNHYQRNKARDALYGRFCRSPNFYSWLEMKFSLEKEASAGLLG